MREFSALTREGLGWYVYLLTDPLTHQPFYVGKGRGNRAFSHEVDAHVKEDEPVELQSAKIQRILQIEDTGSDVEVHILRHDIGSEKLAYDVEAAAIDLVNHLAPHTLLNVLLGHHHAQHGLMSADEVELLYAAMPAPRVEVPILLVSLNRLWTPTISAGDLYEYTRGFWKVAPARAQKVTYVVGVHNGVVRSVYRPFTWRPRVQGDRDWQDDNGKTPRWAFEGESAPEMHHLLRTSVKRFLVQQWSHLYVDPEPEGAPTPGQGVNL